MSSYNVLFHLLLNMTGEKDVGRMPRAPIFKLRVGQNHIYIYTRTPYVTVF